MQLRRRFCGEAMIEWWGPMVEAIMPGPKAMVRPYRFRDLAHRDRLEGRGRQASHMAEDGETELPRTEGTIFESESVFGIGDTGKDRPAEFKVVHARRCH